MSATGFEPLPKPRFQVVSDCGVENIVIPAARNWFILLFIPVWLTGWTFGGIAAMHDLVFGAGGAFLAVWLAFWLVGWLFAASWLGWNISGQETLSIEGGALVRGWKLLGLGLTKRYELAQVSGLTSGTPPFPYGIMKVSYPPFFPMTFGPLKWNYGAATVYAAAGLSEAEAAMIVDRLSARMPAKIR